MADSPDPYRSITIPAATPANGSPAAGAAITIPRDVGASVLSAFSRPVAPALDPVGGTVGSFLGAFRSAAAPGPSALTASRYELVGEIGRGGMGVVIKGRDHDLCRDVAMKVLLEDFQTHDEALRRFVEEARIGGRLTHPGVVPVYELGTLPDRRPYFTMKLVDGKTQAQLLADRRDPHHDLPRFLKIFEQICQTMAYAHSRGVIHRDLKPQNVMVGAFGEVQVMDWGLAKTLASREREQSEDSRPRPENIADGQTHAGQIMGTPAYMPPEQARGDLDHLDERADVFSLGAILCEILTGHPPYAGGGDRLAQAVIADLADGFDRLDRCQADIDLIQLAKLCLDPDPERRPRNAEAVAAAVTAYLTGVQEKLRAAEMERAAARAKVEEERKRSVHCRVADDMEIVKHEDRRPRQRVRLVDHQRHDDVDQPVVRA
ncbi:MAG: serine/threonine-protein kinase, partial [Gemmataceae bacterium]